MIWDGANMWKIDDMIGKETREKFVAALRSGKYLKICNQLIGGPSNVCMCATGVLCDQIVPKRLRAKEPNLLRSLRFDNIIPLALQSELIRLNDVENKSFLFYGACGCMGPLPLCYCARRELANKWRIMLNAAPK